MCLSYAQNISSVMKKIPFDMILPYGTTISNLNKIKLAANSFRMMEYSRFDMNCYMYSLVHRVKKPDNNCPAKKTNQIDFKSLNPIHDLPNFNGVTLRQDRIQMARL